MKTYLFADVMIVYVENPQKIYKQTNKMLRFNKWQDKQKNQLYFYTSNGHMGGKIKNTLLLIIVQKKWNIYVQT